MKQKKIRRLLDRAMQEKTTVTVFFDQEERESRCGLPLGGNDSMVLLAQEDDFQWDGYLMVNRSQIQGVRAHRGLAEEITRKEGLLEDLSLPDVDVSGWQGFFESLRASGRHAIVETHGEWPFTIGPVVGVKKKKVLLRYYDAQGKWEEWPRTIRYEDVMFASFGARYETVYEAYVGSPPEFGEGNNRKGEE